MALTDKFAWDRGSGRQAKASRIDFDVGLSDLLCRFCADKSQSAVAGFLSRVYGTPARRHNFPDPRVKLAPDDNNVVVSSGGNRGTRSPVSPSCEAGKSSCTIRAFSRADPSLITVLPRHPSPGNMSRSVLLLRLSCISGLNPCCARGRRTTTARLGYLCQTVISHASS